MNRFVLMANPISLTASSAVQLPLTGITVSSLFIQGDPLNTNNVYFGNSGCTTTNGLTIQAGEKVAITYDMVFGNNTLINPTDIWLSSDTTGNRVRVGYWQVN